MGIRGVISLPASRSFSVRLGAAKMSYSGEPRDEGRREERDDRRDGRDQDRQEALRRAGRMTSGTQTDPRRMEASTTGPQAWSPMASLTQTGTRFVKTLTT